MQSHEIRGGFLDFFAENGHRIVPSSSLVPGDDPTLLFTNAGMNQFKDLFLGKESRPYLRATTTQKCMRVSGKHNDLDNVGPSHWHHTFFEMLGNFSFGDYFKAEAVEFAWQVLTDVWKLEAGRLHATVFAGEAGIPRDGDAYDLWRRVLPTGRIHELGLDDNFWQMGETGPCGRCSEIHFSRPELPCPHETCRGIECDCDRYIEIWNNVFMEFDRQPDGVLNPLPAPSIDTGMGLERITAVIQGKESNYDTDTFAPLLAAIGNAAGRTYGTDSLADVSMRVVADHMRAMTFLIADGVVPSNEWRGYVLRKIMRRAMRHAKKLDATEPVLHGFVDVLVAQMGDVYPELRTNRDTIVRTVRAEEERFDTVLTNGLARLEEVLNRAAAGSGVVAGEDMFRLYDSLGVPVDFVEDLAAERGLAVDREAFDRAMEVQRRSGRAAGAFEAKKIDGFTYTSDAARATLLATADVFDGYTTTTTEDAEIVALFDESRRQTETLAQGQSGFVVLSRTPFYVEAGGQVSDTGTLSGPTARASVEDMSRIATGGPRVHEVRVTDGRLAVGDGVTAAVDAARRDAIRRNHTATHLLHAALRQTLGPHVKQAGSLVAPDRLRFDFAHTGGVTKDELRRIERLVNEHVYQNSRVITDVKPTADAIAAGAMALFGEKYGDSVRVVSIPTFSMELCGGTHCAATGDIGLFSITSEGGVAAGVRRIEAQTGAGALERQEARSAALDRIASALNVSADQAPAAIEKLQVEVKRLQKELRDARSSLTAGPATGGRSGAAVDTPIGASTLVTARVTGFDKDTMRQWADRQRDRIKSGVVVLASETDDRVALVVGVTKDLVDRIKAGQVISQIAPIVGGRGGGRPDFAEAGGKDASKIDAVLTESRTVVERLLGVTA